MLNVRQFKYRVVIPTLETLPLGGNIIEAANMLTGTALVESKLTFLDQIEAGGDKKIGPALGLFQMEFPTHQDIWKNFLTYRKGLAEAVRLLKIGGLSDMQNLIVNMAYATAMCRVHYLRSDDPLPAANDALGMAKLWKKHYNTIHGAGKVEHATPLFKQAIES